MSYRIEQDILTTAMQHPAITQKIGIDPQWFQTPALRDIYQAVSKYPQRKQNISKWATVAKDNGYRGNDDRIAELSSRNSNIHRIGTYVSYVRTLYKQYLITRISVLGRWNQQRPNESYLTKIKSCMQQLQNITDDTDSTDHAAKGFMSVVHDTKHSKPTGIHTYPELDYVLAGGLYAGCLFTIGARTGVGKTSYAINLAFQIMQNNPKVRVDYFTEEMSARLIADRFLTRATGITNYELRDPHDRIKSKEKIIELQQYAKAYAKSNLHIYDTDHNLDEITSTIRKNARSRKPNTYVAIIDYIGLVNTNDSKDPRYLQVGQITRSFKMLTDDLQIPIIQITQLNRNGIDRDDDTPVLSDIRESGSTAQDSNFVMLLYKNKSEDKKLEDHGMNLSQIGIINALVAKNRAGIGVGRTLKYTFYKTRMTMVERSTHKRKNIYATK